MKGHRYKLDANTEYLIVYEFLPKQHGEHRIQIRIRYVTFWVPT
jgi:hypothetical protein